MMVDPYPVRERDGKWQVCVEDPGKWITCQTKSHALAISEAPSLVYKVDTLGERGDNIASRLELASKAVELARDANDTMGSCIASRLYAHTAEKARGAEQD
jgi:hypothetical protein